MLHLDYNIGDNESKIILFIEKLWIACSRANKGCAITQHSLVSFKVALTIDTQARKFDEYESGSKLG